MRMFDLEHFGKLLYSTICIGFTLSDWISRGHVEMTPAAVFMAQFVISSKFHRAFRTIRNKSIGKLNRKVFFPFARSERHIFDHLSNFSCSWNDKYNLPHAALNFMKIRKFQVQAFSNYIAWGKLYTGIVTAFFLSSFSFSLQSFRVQEHIQIESVWYGTRNVLCTIYIHIISCCRKLPKLYLW